MNLREYLLTFEQPRVPYASPSVSTHKELRRCNCVLKCLLWCQKNTEFTRENTCEKTTRVSEDTSMEDSDEDTSMEDSDEEISMEDSDEEISGEENKLIPKRHSRVLVVPKNRKIAKNKSSVDTGKDKNGRYTPVQYKLLS